MLMEQVGILYIKPKLSLSKHMWIHKKTLPYYVHHAIGVALRAPHNNYAQNMVNSTHSHSGHYAWM